jgi:hypothetical protein
MNKPGFDSASIPVPPDEKGVGNESSVPENVVSHAPSRRIVDWELGPVYESGDIPHPSYVYVAPEGEPQPMPDVMAELAKLRIAANTQRKTLTEANRMPPETAVSRMIAEQTRRFMAEDAVKARQVRVTGEKKVSASPLVPGLCTIPAKVTEAKAQEIPSEQDLPAFLDSKYSNRVGIILGVGKGEFVTQLLRTWKATYLYLVDPYIHIWRGYDEVSNVDDKTHQMIFETLRSQLVEFEGKYMFIRDFSSECMR